MCKLTDYTTNNQLLIRVQVFQHLLIQVPIATSRKEGGTNAAISRPSRPGAAVRIRPIRLPFSAKDKNGASEKNIEGDSEVGKLKSLCDWIMQQLRFKA